MYIIAFFETLQVNGTYLLMNTSCYYIVSKLRIYLDPYDESEDAMSRSNLSTPQDEDFELAHKALFVGAGVGVATAALTVIGVPAAVFGLSRRVVRRRRKA